ncbi:MAG: hypothetical protein RIS47_468 [Bacteroidota bacterium]|jgi:antitoxin component YwqK of YwqJK toxin-antitoxin module
MKRIYIFIALLAFQYGSLAQKFELYKGDTINRIDLANLRQGKWIEFYEKSKKVNALGSYIDNRKDGLWKTYYENGVLQAEITYKLGRQKGYAKTYYEDGKVFEEGVWDSNKWVGSYKAYHSNGVLAYDWNYDEKGKKTGQQRYFYTNGKVLFAGNWEVGRIKGVLKEYYEDGKIKSERSFVDGKIDSSQTRYFEPADNENIADNTAIKVLPKNNSVPEEETERIISGVFTGNGFHKLYNDTLLSREGEFKNGKLFDGKKYLYDDNNIHIKTIIYKDGKAVQVINVGQ